MWKIWPTVCSKYAARDPSERTEPTALSNDDKSSVRVSLAPTTTRGPCKKIPTRWTRGSSWSPTPPGSSDGPPQPWVSQTPQTATEAISQSTLIKDQVAKHQESSPTPIFTSVDQLAKAVVANSHQLTLLTDKVKALREANGTLSKRRTAKRTRLQDSGPLTGKEASQLLVEKGVLKQEERDEGAGKGSSKRRKTTARHYGICRKAGHNARTCPKDIDASSSSDSE